MAHHNGAVLAKPSPYRQNQQVQICDGLGCDKHKNCFTCPLPDCVAPGYQVNRHMGTKYLYRYRGIYSEEPI